MSKGGFWKSGINRAKSGDERIEDYKVSSSNIDSLNEVDLGYSDFVFADDDLKINDSVYLSRIQLSDYMKYITKHGWRIPTNEEIKTLFFSGGMDMDNNKFKIVPFVKIEKSIYPQFCIVSKNNNNALYFNYDNQLKYILADDGCYMDIEPYAIARQRVKLKESKVSNDALMCVRLVKDKK